MVYFKYVFKKFTAVPIYHKEICLGRVQPDEFGSKSD